MSQYETVRERIYGPIREEGVFTWDRMYGEEYALAHLHEIDQATVHEIRQAAQGLGHIYAKTVEVVRHADDALLFELGLPKEAHAACRLPGGTSPLTVIGRFDFAVTGNGVKMLEFNSDTPTSIVEAFHVNGIVCDSFGRRNPNEGMERMLRPAFAETMVAYRAQGVPTGSICFSALDWHDEDAGTTRYLLEQSGLTGKFVPLADLRVYEDRLQAPDESGRLQPVDVLYRLHALEKLAEECDEDGYPTGARVLELIAERKLAIINPPAAFIAQTKALQALIWGLAESGQYFDSVERDIVKTYMLPTYFDETPLQGRPYVRKPILGREGGGVTIYGADGSVIERDQEPHYWEQMTVCQQYAELPAITVKTLRGEQDGKLLWGCFLIGGEPSAIVARVGGLITDNMSYYMPAAIRD